MSRDHMPDNAPLWYQDALIYELHVKAFYDSNADGTGDFTGLTEKLDYLQGLGITALWLLPFYPSPLRDDSYDISDYFNIHHGYGSLRDFKRFLEEAHRRGMRVITELVLNHTSNEHIWFQRARREKPGSKLRDFYVWADNPDKYKDARIIFKDFETSNWAWDPVAKAYYWHRFYYHQPDLNYNSPLLQKEIFRMIDYWLAMGVDGLRLDAVPYLFEREGTSCENLPETHAFLGKLRTHIDGKFKDKMLLAEANQWPEDAVAYFGKGDICHMAFHFPLMPRMFMAIQMEDNFPVIDILKATPSIPDTCQWATFLRNHDELTLEMVTDEERDYMYRVYAQDPRAKINLGIRRRLAPLLGNNRKKIELMNILLFSLPGTPVIYYGDEIGMGDNYYLGDRNGVRTPMQWSADRNAGFSKANPQKLYLPIIIDPEYHYEAINVENQEGNLSSLLWWMKRVIAMRKKYKAFSKGTIAVLPSNNHKVLAFVRKHQNEQILVVINLSRFSQVVQLDLQNYAGSIPQEVFSHNSFPPIEKKPYILALGPHNHYWLHLQTQEAETIRLREEDIPEIAAGASWEHIFEEKEMLEGLILPRFLRQCYWFETKARGLRRVKIVEDTVLSGNSGPIHILILEASYTEGVPELYLLPLAFSLKEKAQEILDKNINGIVAHLSIDDKKGILYDAIYNETFRSLLLSGIARRKKFRGNAGEFVFYPGKKMKEMFADRRTISSQPLYLEQSNTSLVYEKSFFLKLFRRLDEGVNPELDILRSLTEKNAVSFVPPFAGMIEYHHHAGRKYTIGLLEGFISHVSGAWDYTVDIVGAYFEQVLSKKSEIHPPAQEGISLFATDFRQMPDVMNGLIDKIFLEMIGLLGRRTAELHCSLAALKEEAFAAEPFSLLYQKSIYKSMQSLARKSMHVLERNLSRIPENIRKEAENILHSEKNILGIMEKIVQKKISTMKIRIHGDYHLGQILYTGKDLIIIDLEGDNARPLTERRLKRSPFRDVAGMIRSFHYAAYETLFLKISARPEDILFLEPWIGPWYHQVSAIFLQSYLAAAGNAGFIPQDREELEILLQTFILGKALYELGHELENRPERAIIPLRGIADILKINNKQ